MNFSREEQTHLDAAEGWIDLGNYLEANAELEEIAASMRAAPEVLTLRWRICAAAKKWDLALAIAETMSIKFPNDETWILNRAHALKQIGRLSDAYAVLSASAQNFTIRQNMWLMRYRLACYACLLGNLAEAEEHLGIAIDLAVKEDVRSMALDDPELERLWLHISEI